VETKEASPTQEATSGVQPKGPAIPQHLIGQGKAIQSAEVLLERWLTCDSV